jgi:hypothetical protein
MPKNINMPLNFRTQNTLITTKTLHEPFKNESQVKNSAVSNWARPSTNGASVNSNDYVGERARATVQKPFPMKHWRKQLNPTKNSGRSKVSVFDMDRPGGSTIINNCSCESNNDASYIRTDFKALNQDLPQPATIHSTTKVNNNGYIQVGNPEDADSYKIYTGIYQTKYIGCCPENNIIKSANTLLSNAYYSSSSQYLHARCKTYNQKLTVNKDNLLSSEQNIYSTGNCQLNTPKCVNTTIYKPSNTQFATQGAVSSSTRLLKLQVDTITQNGNSFCSAWGAEGANAGKYQGTSMTPYFLKNKYNPGLPNCYRYSGSGNYTSCAK